MVARAFAGGAAHAAEPEIYSGDDSGGYDGDIDTGDGFDVGGFDFGGDF